MKSTDQNLNMKPISQFALTTTSLVTSVSMCVCCALPAFLLLLGAGPILASLFTTFPKLLLIEKYSILLFVISGSLITASGILKWKNRNYACPSDLKERKTCGSLNCFNKYLYIFTIIIFLIGGFSTFILPKLYQNNLF
jgi:hypothetical protein